MPVINDPTWGQIQVNSTPVKATTNKELVADAITKGQLYTTPTGASIILSDAAVASPALQKALDAGNLTKVTSTDGAQTALTASGISIKPFYLLAGVVVLVVAYFIWKKYGKK